MWVSRSWLTERYPDLRPQSNMPHGYRREKDCSVFERGNEKPDKEGLGRDARNAVLFKRNGSRFDEQPAGLFHEGVRLSY